MIITYQYCIFYAIYFVAFTVIVNLKMKTMLQIGLSWIIMKSQVKIKKGRKPESCQAPGVWRQPRSGQITFWRLKQFQFFCSSVCLGYLPNFINSVYCYNKTTFISPNPVMTVPLCMWWGFMIFVVVVAQWPALILDFIPFFFFLLSIHFQNGSRGTETSFGFYF